MPAAASGRDAVVIDSGGLKLGGRERLDERVVEGALRAVAMADVVVFMLDGRAGLDSGDREAVALIWQTGRPLIAAVNKLDRPAMEAAAAEYHTLGISPLVPISAAHGRGIEELLDEVVARLPAVDTSSPTPPDLRLALIGRPNVGKSSLLNRLAGFERAIVDNTPGTTRDPVDVRLAAADRDVLLIDTAGIRRPARVEGELEQFSVGRAIETIRRADVLVLPHRSVDVSGVLFAGLAFGKAMVLSGVGGFREIAEEHGVGVLVPPDDPDELAAAIGGLLGDDARRRQLEKSALAAAAGPFSWDRIAERTASLYEQVRS